MAILRKKGCDYESADGKFTLQRIQEATRYGRSLKTTGWYVKRGGKTIAVCDTFSDARSYVIEGQEV
jgi:hypothetical protein